MQKFGRCLIALMMVMTNVSVASAQPGSRAFGVSGGATTLTTPPGYPRVTTPIISGWFEFGQNNGLAIETRMFLTGANATPIKSTDERYTRDYVVYITRALFAVMAEPSVTYAPVKWRESKVQPYAGLGGTVGFMVLSQSGDLAISELEADAGIVGAAGIRILPARRTSVIARGSYRKMFRDSGGQTSELGLSGPAIEIGLRIRIR